MSPRQVLPRRVHRLLHRRLIEHRRFASQTVEAFLCEARSTHTSGNCRCRVHSALALGTPHKPSIAVAADASRRITEIDRAPSRMATGTYGLCERCHQTIPEKRLKVSPTTTECLGCADRTKSTA